MPLTCSCIGRAWGQVHLGLASLSWASEEASAILWPQLTLATLSGSPTQQWSLEVGTSICPPPHTQQSLKPPRAQRLFVALANLDLPVCATGTCLASSADSISPRESQTLCVCPVRSAQRAALVWEDGGLWNSVRWDGGSSQVGLGWPSAVLLRSLAVSCSGRDGPRQHRFPPPEQTGRLRLPQRAEWPGKKPQGCEEAELLRATKGRPQLSLGRFRRASWRK